MLILADILWILLYCVYFCVGDQTFGATVDLAVNDHTDSDNAVGLEFTLQKTSFQRSSKFRKTLQYSEYQHPEPRIVGGSPADPGEYPSYAYTVGTELCGGTLIHPDIILTAAHCKDAFVGGVLVGGTLLDGSDATFYDVELEFPNPDYQTDPSINDIMLVKLTQAVDAPIQSIQLDPNQQPADGSEVTVIGFGLTSEDGDISDQLLEVTVNVIGFDNCNAVYNYIVDETMICAGVEDGGRDSCQGDSGGPLFDSTGVQVAIVAGGLGCARPGIPAIYTRISGFQQWIRDGICNLSDVPPSDCLPTPVPSKSAATDVPVSSNTEAPVVTPIPTQSPNNTPVPTNVDATTSLPTATVPPPVVPTIAPSLLSPPVDAPVIPPTLPATIFPSLAQTPMASLPSSTSTSRPSSPGLTFSPSPDSNNKPTAEPTKTLKPPSPSRQRPSEIEDLQTFPFFQMRFRGSKAGNSSSKSGRTSKSMKGKASGKYKHDPFNSGMKTNMMEANHFQPYHDAMTSMFRSTRHKTVESAQQVFHADDVQSIFYYYRPHQN